MASTLAALAARLSSRGVVSVTGTDSLRFLQSLVTNDIHALCPPASPVTSAGFLDRRGRLIVGTLLFRRDEHDYLIDAPGAKVEQLIKHLRTFKLRAKVDVADVTPNYSVWQFSSTTDVTKLPPVISTDPRIEDLGFRGVLPPSFEPAPEASVVDEDHFERLRMLKAVPDGGDFDGGALPLDVGLHLINGVSFKKGCYLGQELTARTYFTGVLRKRLVPVVVTSAETAPVKEANILLTEDEALELASDDDALRIPMGDSLFVDGRKKAAGTITSAVGNIGVAVVRLSDAYDTSKRMWLEDGRVVRRVHPDRVGWKWPSEE